MNWNNLTVNIKNDRILVERGVNMSYKKQIVTIMTLVVLLLLMMSATIQAVSLGKVYNLNASMNANQVKLTWSSVSGAAGYNVYVNNTKIGSVMSNQASLVGFSENVTYRFKVAAYDSQKREGTVSEEIRLTTTTQKSLDQVKNLTVTQANGYVTLNWSSVNKATKYQVFVNIPNFGEMNIGEVTTTNVMMKGFQNSKRYGFSIRACEVLSNGNINYGEKSQTKYCTVNYNQDDTKPNTDNDNNNNEITVGKVTRVSVSDINETEATVDWSKADNADGYEVKLSKNNGSYKTIADKVGRTVYLSDLTPDSQYRVKIVAYKKVNGKKVYGEESSYHRFYTDEVNVGKVKNVSVSDITKNSAYVSWSKVTDAKGYNVYLAKGNGSFKYEGTTTSRNYKIRSLNSNTDYRVKVEAYKKVNGKEYTGDFSSIKKFTTEKKAADVKLAKVTNVNKVERGTTVYLSWSKVDNADGYEVDVEIPGLHNVTMYARENLTKVTGVIGKQYYHTARIRAYKVVDGEKVYGPYSNTIKFRETTIK